MSAERNISKLLVILILAATSVGCVAMPQASTLAPGHPAPARSGHEAVIERVVVADPSLSAPDVIEESLTINVAQLVSQAGYFKQVKVVPEQTTDGYRVRLRFDHYQVTRRIHPAYFPVAFATVTLYIWFGGPIFRDQVDLKADLRIQTADGQTLATASDALTYFENIGFYSSKYGFRDGSEERTTLIQSLIDRALAQLQTTGGRS